MPAETQSSLFPNPNPRRAAASIPLSGDPEALFEQGVMLEEDNPSAALALYRRALRIDPRLSAAHINAGTILFHQQDLRKAECHYRAAVAIPGRSEIAPFNLGNVLDEMGRKREAIAWYEEALRESPGYTDAHYNLALAYDAMGNPRAALIHWTIYAKADSASSYGQHAQNAMRRILASDGLQIAASNRSPRRTPERAALRIA